MGKGKLKKFAELEVMENVFQKPKSTNFRGKWNTIFNNDHPIVLELACGKGDYTIALAKRFPNKNFIGIDIKGNRIHVGAMQALEENLENVRFLRIFIDHIDAYFMPNEVNEIWITFPDPYLKPRKASKRLTSSKFLNLYQKILTNNGVIHLKTDSSTLFDYTLTTIKKEGLNIQQLIRNVYMDKHNDILLTEIKTYYEKKHLREGRIIKYVRFTF